mmetsp:Transcript_11515/g.32140  ORF Transcript_11515/g.32140 Transcript_11515/m.32140 type:complete len:163 (+) Transcript_11515:182-670(+)
MLPWADGSDSIETLNMAQLAMRTYNWRTDNKAVPCSEDPKCGYGNVNLDPAAYKDLSPLAIINEDYKKDQVNPFPGPKNWGPDSPIAWLPEDGSVAGLPKRLIWPDYPPPSKGDHKRIASNADIRPNAAVLRIVDGGLLLQAPPAEIMAAEEEAALRNWRRY